MRTAAWKVLFLQMLCALTTYKQYLFTIASLSPLVKPWAVVLFIYILVLC